MKYLTLIRSAVVSLFVNKLRTFLTILGIVIGIMSVISLLNLGKAAQASIESSVSSIGSNLISVIPGKLKTSSGFNLSVNERFKMEDVDALINTPMYFVSGIATSDSSVYKIQYGKNDMTLSVLGVYGDFWSVRNIEVIQGREITNREIEGVERVAIVGPDLVDDLFDGKQPIGEKIKINNQNFTVIGVTKAQGSNGFTNPDTNIYIPLTASQQYLTGKDEVSAIYASSKDPDLIKDAGKEIDTVLRRLHNIPDGEDSDFTVRNSQQALSILDQITGILTAFLAAIGAISLLVGGIGIMNIMFVTVNERTKEIGLRKALGATKTDILSQFLVEAVLVTLLGGILGTALGLALTWLITTLAALPFIISIESIVLAVGVSATIGLIFGIYPAWKAAQLSPIEALRYE